MPHRKVEFRSRGVRAGVYVAAGSDLTVGQYDYTVFNPPEADKPARGGQARQRRTRVVFPAPWGVQCF